MNTQIATHRGPPHDSPIEIVSRGPIGERSRRRLRRELARVADEAPRDAIFVRGALTYEQNPAVDRPALASATLARTTRRPRSIVALASAGLSTAGFCS